MIRNTLNTAEGHGSLLVLALLALIVGAAAGLVGAIFRLTLEQADRLRDALIAWARKSFQDFCLLWRLVLPRL
jgi:chloride channel protein, CIC family